MTWRLATTIGIAGIALGCATSSEAISARTLGRGVTQFSAQLDAAAAVALSPVDAVPMLPSASIGVMHGVRDDLDLGVRLGNGGLEARARWRLLEGQGAAATLTVAPSIAESLQVVAFLSHVSLPVLVSFEAGPKTEFVASLSIHYAYLAGTADGGDLSVSPMQALFPGASVSVFYDLTPQSKLGMHLSVYGPAIGSTSRFLSNSAVWSPVSGLIPVLSGVYARSL